MKHSITFILLILGFMYASAQQPTLTLDKCYEMALEHNHKIKIAQQNSATAAELTKAAKTMYLPDISLNGAYTHMGKNYQYDLTIPETTLPVGQLDLNGDWTLPPSMWANQWTALPDGTNMPLDASGNPFDPTANPENIIPAEWAYIPETPLTLETDFNDIITANVGIVQPIYMGGKIKETNNIARYARNIEDARVDLKESEILFETEKSYWRIVNVSEKLKLAEQYGRMLDELVKRLEDLYLEGFVNNNDVLKAKVKQNEIQLNIKKAQNGLRLSQMSLCQLVGLPLYDEVLIADTSIYVEQVKYNDAEFVEKGISKRQEIEMLNQSVGIAESTEALMKSRYLPNIIATANYLVANPNPYNGLAHEFGGDWNAGVIVNIPIYHFGAKKHTLAAAKHEATACRLKLDEAKEMIALQIQQLSYKGSESVIKVELSEKTVNQAEENLSITQANFDEGIIATSDLLEAQTLWQKAMSEYIEAKIEYKTSLSELKKALGELNKESVINNTK